MARRIQIFKTISKRIIVVFSLFVLVFSYTLTAYAAVPTFINYQGRLRDSSSNAVTSATTIQFSIYNDSSSGLPSDTASSAGPLLWTEKYDQASGSCVQINPDSEGYFTVELSSCTSFPSYLDFTNGGLYVGVKIGSDSEATPRAELGSAPFAFTADHVSGVGQSTIGTTTPVSGAVATIEATTTNSVALAIRGFASQTADLFRIIKDTGAKLLTFTAGGFLGIGTSSPSALFSIANTGSGFTAYIGDEAGDASPFVIDASGNVGVGTTSPYAKLSVVGEVVGTNFTATSTTATSTFPYLSVSTNSNLGTVIGGTWQGNTLSVAYGGTGSTTPSQFLYGDGAGNLTSTSTIAQNFIDSAIARVSQLHSAVTLSGSYNYLTLSGQDIALGQIDLATDVTGTLPVSNGGTGSTTPSGLLYGGNDGTLISTSTIAQNYIDSALARTANVLTLSNWFATTTQALISSLPALSVTESQISNLKHFDGSDFYTYLNATTTDVLSEGSANLYFTNARADARINATSTIDTLTSLANLATVGALDSGSITSNFGTINTGASNITTTGTISGGNIVASGVLATSTFAGGLAVNTSGLVYDYSTGNLGIGTTTPAYKLDVYGTARTSDLITSSLVFTSSSTAYSTLSSYGGFNGYINASGGFGTGGNDSVLNAQRLTAYGNLTNIGSFQGGELSLTTGGTFASKVDYTTGTSPFSVSIGDLNGDGYADIAVANNGSNTVSVYLNNGDGTFATKVDYTTGSSPKSISIGDLNGDGKADLAVANNGSATASVLINNGDGTFASKVDYTTGTSPFSVSIADLNGDGKADLAVANSSSNTASVYLNNGDGTFASKVDYTTGTSPRSVSIGDLNGDGKADLAVANFTSNTASVFINNGDDTFASKVDYTTGTGPKSISIGDLNGDGKADFVVINWVSSTASVFINNGDGTFASKVDYTTGTSPFSVSIADLNGDGKADLAVANYTSATASVFLNNGDGTFASKVDYSTGTNPLSVSIGDLNGDGKADLAVANYNSATISVLINNATPLLFASASPGTSGNVGIGTSSPYSKLSVAGNGVFDGTVTASIFTSTSTTATSTFAGGLAVNTSGFVYDFSTGNVGIGTASPSEKLNVTGNILSTGTILGSNLSGTNTGDQDLSSLVPYTGATANVDLGTYNLHTTGKIGIGTVNPNYPLDVNSSSPWVGSTDSDTGIYAAYTAYGTNASYPRASFDIGSNKGDSIANVGFWVYPSVSTGIQKPAFIEAMTSPDTSSAATKRLILYQSTTLGMIKTSSQSGNGAGTDLKIYTQGVTNPQLYLQASTGYLGVGVSTPGVQLDVDGTHVSGIGMARFKGNAQYGYVSLDTTTGGATDQSGMFLKVGGVVTGQFGVRASDSAFYIRNRVYGNTDMLTLASNGNVGIGTTTPQNLLSVTGDIQTDSTGDTAQLLFSNDGANKWGLQQINSDSSGRLRFYDYSNSTERLTLTASGNVGIGTTTPALKLQIASDVTTGASLLEYGQLMLSGATNPNDRMVLGYDSTNNLGFINAGESGVAWHDLILQGNGGNVGINMTNPSVALDVTGDIEYTGTITDVSDERLKENIIQLSSNLDKILQLRPVSFNMIGDSRLQLGFTAQNAQQVFPNTVSVVDPENGYLGLDYVQLISPTIGAIQELDLNLEEIASTTASSTPQSQSFAKSFFSNLFGRVSVWLADATNGITNIFANVFNAKEKICVDGECLTKSDIRKILELTNSQTATVAPTVDTPIPSDQSAEQVDTEAPVITINGNNPAEISIGETYEDSGAIVTDNVDKNLEYKVSLDDGEETDPNKLYVDTSTSTTYTITYTATDQAGNVGNATRTIIVGTEVTSTASQGTTTATSSPDTNTPDMTTTTTTTVSTTTSTTETDTTTPDTTTPITDTVATTTTAH